MSVIEDSRKVMQDLIAPELRAIDSWLTASKNSLRTVSPISNDR